jgi:putative MATE family efflux protein
MKIRKDVYKMALPVLTEQLFITSIGVLNTIIASGLGKEAISAIGTVDSFNNIIIFFFNSLALGGTVVAAQYSGQKNYKGIKEVTRQSIFSAVVLSFITTLIIWFCRDIILQSFLGNAEEQVRSYASVYFNIALFNYPLTAFAFVVSGILRATGRQNEPMKINIIINVINIILSYFFVYGISVDNIGMNISISGMGVKGAAIAITVARLVGALLFVYALYGKFSRIRFKTIKEFKLNMAMQKSIFNVGLPAGIETFLFSIGKFVQQIFIISLGTVSMASNTIAWSVFGLLIIPGNALCIVATTMVGNFMGMGNHEEAEKINLYQVKLATVGKVIISVIIFPLAAVIAAIYSKDPEVVRLTAQIIRMNAVAIPILWPASFIIPSGLRGAGDSKFTMVVSITSLWFFRVFVGYIFSITLNFGVTGLWMAMYFDFITRGITYYLRLKRGKWKERVVIT